ncbi:proline-rich receptor-like protein kinase PERK14 [Tupaia chinensis]|uniref:proline-rich receptor-like protein kinase PERK14 n=1 Tax=Tupaia chinensis TaxID=246437 RepID=UPI000FFC113E|nr:proline-rich receptor-like protein kinase PERK14 [Tupaia chinensis]
MADALLPGPHTGPGHHPNPSSWAHGPHPASTPLTPASPCIKNTEPLPQPPYLCLHILPSSLDARDHHLGYPLAQEPFQPQMVEALPEGQLASLHLNLPLPKTTADSPSLTAAGPSHRRPAALLPPGPLPPQKSQFFEESSSLAVSTSSPPTDFSTHRKSGFCSHHTPQKSLSEVTATIPVMTSTERCTESLGLFLAEPCLHTRPWGGSHS